MAHHFQEPVVRTGVAVVRRDGADLVLRMTQGRAEVFPADLAGRTPGKALAAWVAKDRPAPGGYRMRLVGDFVRGFRVDRAARVSLEREIRELGASGAGSTRARTGAPGIKGFLEAERASQGAADNRRAESGQMAVLLRELVGKEKGRAV